MSRGHHQVRECPCPAGASGGGLALPACLPGRRQSDLASPEGSTSRRGGDRPESGLAIAQEILPVGAEGETDSRGGNRGGPGTGWLRVGDREGGRSSDGRKKTMSGYGG